MSATATSGSPQPAAFPGSAILTQAQIVSELKQSRPRSQIYQPTPFTQAQTPIATQSVAQLPPFVPLSQSVPMNSTGTLVSPLGQTIPMPFVPIQATMTERPVSPPVDTVPAIPQPAPASPRTAEQKEIEEMAEKYSEEMGTEKQLIHFFKKYAHHKGISSKCYLNGRYFWKVLAPYAGLVDSELYVRINLGETENVGEEIHRGIHISNPVLDWNDLAETKDAPNRFRLIKMLVDISDDPESNVGAVHANLIVIDTHKKEILRFEPMFDENLTDPINTVLEEYFAQDGLLPHYSYSMLHEHPQLPTTESCPSKGMCAAYVLNKAMRVITGNDRPLDLDPKIEEIKIMHFADAVETEWGLLPDDDGTDAGFGGAAMSETGSMYPPEGHEYPHYIQMGEGFHGPEFYGYVHGPRYGRRYGYGWGSRRHHMWGRYPHHHREEHGSWARGEAHLGFREEHGGQLDALKSKMNAAHAKVKAKITGKEASSKAKPMIPAGPDGKIKSAKSFEEIQNRTKAQDTRVQPKYNAEEEDLQAYGGVDAAEMSSKKTIRPETGSTCSSGMATSENLPRDEYGCGCGGSSPRTEYGDPKWKPSIYGGVQGSEINAGASYSQGFGMPGRPADPRDVTKYGTYLPGGAYVRPINGPGQLTRPSTWAPETKTAAIAGVAGAAAGGLMAGWTGALLLGGIAAGAGYLLSRNGQRRQYGYVSPAPMHMMGNAEREQYGAGRGGGGGHRGGGGHSGGGGRRFGGSPVHVGGGHSNWGHGEGWHGRPWGHRGAWTGRGWYGGREYVSMAPPWWWWLLN